MRVWPIKYHSCVALNVNKLQFSLPAPHLEDFLFQHFIVSKVSATFVEITCKTRNWNYVKRAETLNICTTLETTKSKAKLCKFQLITCIFWARKLKTSKLHQGSSGILTRRQIYRHRGTRISWKKISWMRALPAQNTDNRTDILWWNSL